MGSAAEIAIVTTTKKAWCASAWTIWCRRTSLRAGRSRLRGAARDYRAPGSYCSVRESVLTQCRRGNARVRIQFYVQRVRRTESAPQVGAAIQLYVRASFGIMCTTCLRRKVAEYTEWTAAGRTQALAPKGRILRIVVDGYAYGRWRSVAIGAGRKRTARPRQRGRCIARPRCVAIGSRRKWAPRPRAGVGL